MGMPRTGFVALRAAARRVVATTAFAGSDSDGQAGVGMGGGQ
jgi:hypothetical protein